MQRNIFHREVSITRKENFFSILLGTFVRDFKILMISESHQLKTLFFPFIFF